MAELIVQNIKKSYKKNIVVKDISLTVQAEKLLVYLVLMVPEKQHLFI